MLVAEKDEGKVEWMDGKEWMEIHIWSGVSRGGIWCEALLFFFPFFDTCWIRIESSLGRSFAARGRAFDSVVFLAVLPSL